MVSTPDPSGWICVAEECDAELVATMLENNGINAAVALKGTRYRRSRPAVWVCEEDYDRAAELVDKMGEEMRNPPTGPPWRCQSCSEENEVQFDVCWKCGSDRPSPR
jgi:hypothetical protein